MSVDLPLPELQRWFARTLHAPLGGPELFGEPSDTGSLASISAEEIITRSSQLSSHERLQIYQSAYFARLEECLREEFPILARLLGEETFPEMAREYLQHNPSRSYTLAQLGANFPRFLEETRPPMDAHDPQAYDWPLLLVEVARLERADAEVFDAPGGENVPGLTPQELQQIPAEKCSELRFQCIPGLRLEQFAFPVHDYVSRVRRVEASQVEEIPWPDRQPTFLAFNRQNYLVRRVPLTEPAYRVLQVLQQQKTLSEALDQAAEAFTDTEEDFLRSIPSWFERFTTERLIVGIAT